MKLHHDDGSLELINDSLGKPELVIDQFHIPLADPRRFASVSKLRVWRNGQSFALKSMWNFMRVINRIYWSGEQIVFKRFNGETAYVLPIAGR